MKMKKLVLSLMLASTLLLTACTREEKDPVDPVEVYQFPFEYDYDGPTFPEDKLEQDFWTEKGGIQEVELHRAGDGDTAEFKMIDENGNIVVERVRFISFDTREFTQQGGFEKWGKPASVYMTELLEDAETLHLQSDPQGSTRDNYGRLIAWVWIDKQLAQYIMVDLGLGYVVSHGSRLLYVDELDAAETEAMKARIGVWSNDLDPYWDEENNRPKS